MKKIISVFTVVIIMAIVYTTELTNANAKELYQTPSSFSISYVPGNGAPGNESTISYITINSNECDLVMSNMVNCYVGVTFININKSPIIIYSPCSYHINLTPQYIFNYPVSLKIDLLPIDQNSPAYCSGSITAV